MVHPGIIVLTCSASSRVGERVSACVSLEVVLTVCNTPMENTAVFPVPDCDCAMTSRPWMMGLMARCWMAEGRSNPTESYVNVMMTTTVSVVEKEKWWWWVLW